jgi:hypothetical protein
MSKYNVQETSYYQPYLKILICLPKKYQITRAIQF